MFLPISISLLLIAATIASGTFAPNLCNDLHHGALVRNTEDCNSYYYCFNGIPIKSYCPENQLFNHHIRNCDRHENVDCFNCPANSTLIDLPTNNECIQFIRCFNNTPRQLTCAEGLAFDRTYAMCNLVEKVNCPFIVECPQSSASLIFIRDPNNCTRYFICAEEGEAIERLCPNRLHFNLKTNQCDLPENTDCSISSVSVPSTLEILECPRNGGPSFPHPTDCQLSYICNDANEAVVYPCRDGLYFDYAAQGCGSKEIVNCFIGDLY